MVDTKLLAQAAIDPISLPRRQMLLAAALAAMSMSVGARTAVTGVIAQAQSYAGARLVQHVDPTGMPEVGPNTFGVMTMFVFPVAIAATTMDLYIADPGLGRLLRYDLSLDAMFAIPGARVTQLSRIAALPDGSVVLAHGGSAPAKRYARNGRLLQSLDPQLGSGFYDEVVADPNTGRFYGLDRVQGRLEEIMPHGRGAVVLSPGLLPDLPVAMAIDRRRLYVAGRACRCVVAIDLFGSRGSDVIADNLGNITALAAGDGWLVLMDGMERQLHIYRDGVLRADPGFAELHLVNPQGMAVINNILYVADPGGRRISTYRLRS